MASFPYRSSNEGFEYGMRSLRSTLVLRMELHADKERMLRLRELHNLGQARLGIVTGGYQAGFAEVFGVLGIELVAVLP